MTSPATGARAASGPSFAAISQIGSHAMPTPARTAKATCQLYVLMSQASAGAENSTPTEEPMLTMKDGSERLAFGNHLKMQWLAIAIEGPSAAPRMIRLTSSTAKPTSNAIGTSVSAQTAAMVAMIHFDEMRSAIKPTPIADSE